MLRSCFFLSVSAFAESPPAKILYVGAIAINPCQDAKVLADWYSRFGIEAKEIQGGYYGQLNTAAGPFSLPSILKKLMLRRNVPRVFQSYFAHQSIIDAIRPGHAIGYTSPIGVRGKPALVSGGGRAG